MDGVDSYIIKYPVFYLSIYLFYLHVTTGKIRITFGIHSCGLWGISFKIVNLEFTVSNSYFFPSFCVNCLADRIKFGQGRLLSFYLHFSIAMGVINEGPMWSDPA